jgi:hypothetical protein
LCQAMAVLVIVIAILQPELDQQEEVIRSRLQEFREAQLNREWRF